MKELKSIRLMLLTLCVAGIGISGCRTQAGKKALSSDKGVLINGVRWATRNVDAPGTFATNPEDAVMFYQWNSNVGWPATGAVPGWDSDWNGGFTTALASDTWTAVNDPSPTGYRVPTKAEIKTLFDTAKVTNTWTTINSIPGRKFTDRTTGNSIFLPVSCSRNFSDGTLGDAGSYGSYWSSTAHNVGNAYYLIFDSGNADWGTCGRANGLTVRSVSK